MTLEAGTLTVTLEFAQGLKDKDWFGRQDPYCLLTCGSQTFRSKVHEDGGKDPVWNQTFMFNIINENNVDIKIFDHDHTSRDDPVGTACISLATVRVKGSDHVKAPVNTRRSKQHGVISVALAFAPNRAAQASAPQYGAYPAASGPYPANPYGPPAAYGQPPQGYGYPPMQFSPYPQAPYGAPQGAYGVAPAPYGAPQAPYGAPQVPYGGPPGPYGAPQGPYGGPPGPYGAPQGPYGGYPQPSGYPSAPGAYPGQPVASAPRPY